MLTYQFWAGSEHQNETAQIAKMKAPNILIRVLKTRACNNTDLLTLNYTFILQHRNIHLSRGKICVENFIPTANGVSLGS